RLGGAAGERKADAARGSRWGTESGRGSGEPLGNGKPTRLGGAAEMDRPARRLGGAVRERLRLSGGGKPRELRGQAVAEAALQPFSKTARAPCALPSGDTPAARPGADPPRIEPTRPPSGTRGAM
ncbi:MAG: hypothetical protein LBR80_15035, partial [Deltaproteobacteria bacterium]|nr:hypothetical protein [Deltaproteobacteria bacterium]